MESTLGNMCADFDPQMPSLSNIACEMLDNFEELERGDSGLAHRDGVGSTHIPSHVPAPT
jgi:hypothetical protein